MMNSKFVQTVGNTIVHEMMMRHPSLTLRFFAGQAGSQMRLFIADIDDPRQLTGRLYDLGETPAPNTIRVKDLAELLQERIEAEIRAFLRTQSDG